MYTPRSAGVGYLLWLVCFFGFCGLHRFYMGKWVSGLIWLFTLGLLGIGQFIDLFLMPSMAARANERMVRDGQFVVLRQA